MNMKNTFTGCAIMAMAALSLSLGGCKQEPTNEATETNIELVAGTKKDTARVSINIPVYADETVMRAIMEQLVEALDGSYEGDLTDVDSLARYLLKSNMDEMAGMHDEDEETWDEEMEFMTHFERELTVSKVYENDRFVTLNIQYYQYAGGAHGISTDYGMTFRKSDGRQMGKNILNNLQGDEGWRDMMYQGLMEYFEVESEEELSACLFEPELYKLELPGTEPYLTEEGLTFVYQQYEIAAYCYGMPSFTIPYDKLDKYLNTTGKRLLNDK